MGCPYSRRTRDANDSTIRTRAGPSAAAASAAALPEPPPPKPTDPRLPLTAKQLFSIGKSWKGIARAMEPTGVAMFVTLFQEHDDMRLLFTKFQNLYTRETQEQSSELQEHATLVMSTLDESIQALDNLDFFFDFLHQIGANHTKIPGFEKDFFWKIEKPFLAAVKTTLADRYTENIETIYTITIRFILETLVKGFEQATNKSSS